jgi:hypothetical protein
MSDTAERRAEPRNPALLSAKIIYGEREEFVVDCVMRSTSDNGGRLRSSLPTLPDRFKLLLYKTGELLDAEVAWRGTGELGVKLAGRETLDQGSSTPRNLNARRLWSDAVLQGI